MKIVAISQRVDNYPDRGESRDALDGRLNEWIIAAGYIPVPVPNNMAAAGLQKWLEKINPQGIILSGGNTIGECASRDHTETTLLDYAREHKLPALGICRGMQMMSVWDGGSLKNVSNHVRVRHVLDGDFRNKSVNSYHDQAIVSVTANFSIMAKSEDGEIEAIRHNSLPWQGWMWHPEREEDFLTGDDLVRLKAILEAS